ncbi:Rieske (2Fe-2S) protein [Nitrincola sp. MINF-07-Sa-05]|uniref:Rieske (2Fe-2S) protein n=1 Tax=Nitrincola salilacus TaxID=3400273 RepID=UPI0039182002
MLLCTLDQLPERESRGFELEQMAVFAIRCEDRVYVYRNSCPHRGIRLEWQPDQFLDHERQFIQCATHGALFKLETGVCIAGPCPGETLEQIPCRIEDNKVYLQLALQN